MTEYDDDLDRWQAEYEQQAIVNDRRARKGNIIVCMIAAIIIGAAVFSAFY